MKKEFLYEIINQEININDLKERKRITKDILKKVKENLIHFYIPKVLNFRFNPNEEVRLVAETCGANNMRATIIQAIREFCRDFE